MNICFFSDQFSTNFKPLTLTRPLDDLRVGIFTIREKWIKILNPLGWIRQVDSYLSAIFPSGIIRDSEDYIWINSRFLPSIDLVSAIHELKANSSLTLNGQLIAIRISADETKHHIESNSIPPIEKSSEISFETPFLQYFWDLLSLNHDQISFDVKLLPVSFQHDFHFDSSTHFLNNENIYIHETANIEPGCIIIANKGPVYVGKNAIIEAGTILKGPVSIGEASEIKMGGRIFNGSTIGPYCKVGGEINNCIFHSYSNKAHDGFMGSSIIGKWNNFGAATNTSNLKNNYSLVRLFNWDDDQLSVHGVQFFGSVFGDFSKTAINTRLNTGTICGVSSNIFCSSFPPKKIPSFTWLGEKSEVYQFDKALEAMDTMMKRRGMHLEEEYAKMMRHIFSLEHSTSS
jgi:UDP-N-acetylglucosamine diphosphorylase/glucosamine-1-phosphate N-acetyltransferase